MKIDVKHVVYRVAERGSHAFWDGWYKEVKLKSQAQRMMDREMESTKR